MIHVFTQFAANPTCSSGGFFGLPTWYKYLKVEYSPITKKCEVQFQLMKDGKFNGDDVILVGLSVIDILIRIAALIAVFFVIYGGIKYITSQGSPDGTKAAQSTIQNALVGLIITIVAAAFVSFIGTTLT